MSRITSLRNGLQTAAEHAREAWRNLATPPVEKTEIPRPVMSARDEYELTAKDLLLSATRDHYLVKSERRNFLHMLTRNMYDQPELLQGLGLTNERLNVIGECAILSAYGDYATRGRPNSTYEGLRDTVGQVLHTANREIEMGLGEFRLPEFYFGNLPRKKGEFGKIASLHPQVGDYGREIMQAWTLNSALQLGTVSRGSGSLSHIYGSYTMNADALGLTPRDLGIDEALIPATSRDRSGDLIMWADKAQAGTAPNQNAAIAQMSDSFMARFDPGAQDSYSL